MAVDWMQAARDALAKQFGGQTAFPEVPQYLQQRAQQTLAPQVTGTPAPTPALPGAANRAATAFATLSAPRQSAVQTAGFAPLEAFSDFSTPQTPRSSFLRGDGFNLDAPVRQAFNKGFQGLDQTPVGANAGQVGGMAGESGYALLDQHNNEINAAAAKFGVPANLLKAMINQESSGDWARDNRVYGGFRDDEILPFVGIFRKTADAWGLNFDAMIGNKQAQIDGMATILSGLAKDYGGYENAAKVYFGGEAALNGGFTDELGMDSNTYGGKVVNLWHELDQKAGFSGDYSNLPTFGAGETGLSNNSVLQEALKYVGVPYTWGGIPGKGNNPWDTGWDCSGMTYWLDQNFGGGRLPQGSHWQFKYAQDTGQLFTDLSQLQPGDLVFIDTGWYGGAGGNLNGAGHVGVYIGNGQMLHAANPESGTIVSPLSGYGGILGAMHQSFSGGSGGGFGGGFNSGFQNPFRR